MPAELLAGHTSRFTESFDTSSDHRPARKWCGRVLVVDDCSHGRWMICDILRTLGLETESVDCGRAACDLARTSAKGGKPFDLVLMDSHMPEMDGYQSASLLRTKGYKGPVVVLTTPSSLQFRTTEARPAACTGTMSKPITYQMLRDLLRQYLPQEPRKATESRKWRSSQPSW
jgi:CheY-like chemotaxis protein